MTIYAQRLHTENPKREGCAALQHTLPFWRLRLIQLHARSLKTSERLNIASFSQDILNVALHSVLGNVELFGDVFVRISGPT